MDRSRKFAFLIAALAMAGVFTVACDSGTTEPAAPEASMQHSDADAMDSQADSSPHTAGTPDGEAATIPEEFPDGIPVYPGSVAAQGKGGVSDGVPMAAVQFDTSDTPEEVYGFYMDKLNREGWTIETRKDLEGKNAVSATNGECTATMLAAPNEDGGSSIFILTEC